MFATNHGLAGIVIGATLSAPVAVPIAFVSHFIMDAIPHYGVDGKTRNSNLNYQKIVHIDTAIALSFAVITAAVGRWDMFFVGWVAYSPDIYWVYMHFKEKKNFDLKPNNKFAKFHQKIQREHKNGWIVEVPVAVSLCALFLYLIY